MGLFTAGYEQARYRKSILTDGPTWSSREVPTDATVHAVRDRRPPPKFDIFLDRGDSDWRVAWCGVRIKVVTVDYFDPSDPLACPACVKVVSAVPPQPEHYG